MQMEFDYYDEFNANNNSINFVYFTATKINNNSIDLIISHSGTLTNTVGFLQ